MNSSAVSHKARALIILAVFSVTFFLYHFKILDRFELVTYDYRMILRGERPQDSRIAIVEISDDSVDKIGQWPWSRDWHAAMIKTLDELGAKAIIFDVLFSEAANAQKDAVLAQAVKESGRVYLARLFMPATPKTPARFLTSLPDIGDHARGTGHINLNPDRDGVMRRMKPVSFHEGQNTPQLSLAVALNEYGTTIQDVKVGPDALQFRAASGEKIEVPLDHRGNLVINWAGRWKNTFKHYSYADVLTSYAKLKKGEKTDTDLDGLKGKFVFIGSTATGLFDIRPTPLEPLYPAVGVNMTLLDNLLQRQFIRTAPWWFDFVLFLIVAALLFFVTQISSFFKKAVFTLAVFAGYTVFAFFIFIFGRLVINVIYAQMIVVASYFFVTAYNEIVITVERSKLLRMATRDPLTGLHNIAHFKLLLGAEISTLPVRTGKKISILMTDVDHFKHTNDTYGHVVGDVVLKEVAQILKNTCRALDIVGRYGGEEFIIMLVGANAEEAFRVGEKIRTALSEKTFENPKGNFHKTISIGVTALSAADATRKIEDVVARADRALYEAKETGRNKVVIAKDSPAPPKNTGS